VPALLLRCLPLALVALIAFGLRTIELGRRPMHADEGNQGVKTGELLEQGRYAFDPRDHHGPTLYYAAAGVARLRGQRTLAELSETTLRLVPALFGTASVILLAGLAAPLGRWPALAAALLAAIAPPAVYYSRYFIQESLLVTFTLATLLCLHRWWQSGLTRWALAAGVGAGLMQATKATAPLFLGAAALALLATRAGARPATRRPGRDALAAAGAALFVAALLFASFGANPSGLRDALATYGHALTRFGSDAAPTGHEKPWWFYLHLFGIFSEGGLLWQQIAFSALALAGAGIALVRREPLARATALYGVLILAVFSALPYKTPWHAVHFVPVFALLAAVALSAASRQPRGCPLAVAIALATAGTLLHQTRLTSFLRPADWRNPWAYVHSSPDVLKFRTLVDAARSQSPGQPIRVISEEYWPLPWYLRGLSEVGYWHAPPADCDGTLVISSTTHAEAVRAQLRRTYRESFLGLRPGVVLVVFTLVP
jgi:uncharacterized protein (TIGR03663 family)